MPTICYVPKRFSPESLAVVDRANAIIAEYQAQGYDLTLRQCYYQFVARGLIPNENSEYKRLGSIINDARLAGMIDWDAIKDRTRFLRSNSHWNDPADIIKSAASSYAIDKWDGQKYRIECWIEKDALVGVIEPVCERNDVAYFSCRGYTSQSEMWEAAQRLRKYIEEEGCGVVILHLGDHDPSGQDMSRDIEDRLKLFLRLDLGLPDSDVPLLFKRLALNMDQVREYEPPPNPTKITDSRAAGYITKFGDESWELDALDPQVINDLIEEAIADLRDDDAWEEKIKRETQERGLLEAASAKWPKIEKFIGDGRTK